MFSRSKGLNVLAKNYLTKVFREVSTPVKRRKMKLCFPDLKFYAERNHLYFAQMKDNSVLQTRLTNVLRKLHLIFVNVESLICDFPLTLPLVLSIIRKKTLSDPFPFSIYSQL